MKLVLSWLNELAPLGNDVEALSATMTALGLEVEAVHVAGVDPMDGDRHMSPKWRRARMLMRRSAHLS